MRAFAPLIAFALVLALPAAAREHSERLTYRIQHQLWGDIGTLSQNIERDGTATKVTTDIAVHVSLFGITLHDAHGQWNEVWQDGGLQKFNATTIADGATETTNGRRVGDVFTIRAGNKRIEAPTDVQPVNPWSLQFVGASTLMSPETGRLIPAAIHDAGMASVTLQGSIARLHHYVVEADGTHHLYFDGDGTLVRFEFADLTGKAIATLAEPYGVAIADAR
jgi:hypothetical protein